MIGGVVYRGASLPLPQGACLFADFCSGELWYTTTEGGMEPLGVSEWAIAAFGRGYGDEVFIPTFDGPILQLAATVGTEAGSE